MGKSTGESSLFAKEVAKMTKKLMTVFLALAVVMAFTLPVLAQDTVKGKIERLDREAKRIIINGEKYLLSDEAVQAEVEVGDEVKAIVDGVTVTKLTKL
jgi:uncharacterized protein (AIM24 family)